MFPHGAAGEAVRPGSDLISGNDYDLGATDIDDAIQPDLIAGDSHVYRKFTFT